MAGCRYLPLCSHRVVLLLHRRWTFSGGKQAVRSSSMWTFGRKCHMVSVSRDVRSVLLSADAYAGHV